MWWFEYVDERFVSAPVVPVEMKSLYERNHHVEQAFVCGCIAIRLFVFFGRRKEGAWRKLLIVSCDNDVFAAENGWYRILRQHLRGFVENHIIELTGCGYELGDGQWTAIQQGQTAVRTSAAWRISCGKVYVCDSSLPHLELMSPAQGTRSWLR